MTKQDEQAATQDEARRWPDPGRCARGTPKGIEATLADGKRWTLAFAGAARRLAPYRDRIFDDITLTNKVKGTDIRIAAFYLLNANYDLEEQAALDLINGAEPDALAEAVVDAMLWQDAPRRTYTAWIESSLYANGIDPQGVPPEMLTFVLDQLVATKRAIPLQQFCDAAEAKHRRAAFFALIPRKDD